MKSILSTVLLYLVEYYTANCVSWIPRLTLLDLQIGIMSTLSEWNLFICRGLTVLFNLFSLRPFHYPSGYIK